MCCEDFFVLFWSTSKNKFGSVDEFYFLINDEKLLVNFAGLQSFTDFSTTLI